MKDDLRDAIKIVQARTQGTGKDLVWLIMNGAESYGVLFEILGKISRKPLNESWIRKSDLLKRAVMPSSAAAYPLYKFRLEGLILMDKPSRETVIFINEHCKQKWALLAESIKNNA